jgi:hypothetical protein
MFQINSLESLNKLPSITNKLMVARFKMDGCIHCIHSQPLWNNMLNQIKQSYQISPNTLICEIDSTVSDEFVNHFKCKTEDNMPYSVSGFPEHAIIANGIVFKSNSDVPTTMKTILQKLKENKHIVKRKSKRKSKRKTQRKTKLK